MTRSSGRSFRCSPSRTSMRRSASRTAPRTPQFASIFKLQWQGEPARSFPFGATHVDDLPYLWEYLGSTLPFTDDQLELSDQMIGFWSRFQYNASPNGPYLPAWPRFNRSEEWMSLDAC